MSACPACGGPLAPWRSVPPSEPGLTPAFDERHRVAPSELAARKTFELVRCRSCGTAVTLGAPPTELHATGAYGPGAPRLAGLAAPVLKAFDRQRLALLARAARPPARLLDVGAGRGRFVASARAAGYHARGIEPSLREPVASLEQITIEDAAVETESLDAVTLWHVLEHLDDPRAAVARIASWLAPDGAMLVGVPNLASIQARMTGGRWYHLDVPRHRTHFTPAGLHALLLSHGLTPLSTTHLLVEQNVFGMWQSWVNLLTETPSYLYNLLKRNAPARSRDLAITLAMAPMLPFAALAEGLAGAARRGGTIAVLARREPDRAAMRRVDLFAVPTFVSVADGDAARRGQRLARLRCGGDHRDPVFPDVSDPLLDVPREAEHPFEHAFLVPTDARSVERARVGPGRLARSLGGASVLAGLVGGMSVCHGAGGIASHRAFGARTGGAPLPIAVAVGAALWWMAGVRPQRPKAKRTFEREGSTRGGLTGRATRHPSGAASRAMGGAAATSSPRRR